MSLSSLPAGRPRLAKLTERCDRPVSRSFRSWSVGKANSASFIGCKQFWGIMMWPWSMHLAPKKPCDENSVSPLYFGDLPENRLKYRINFNIQVLWNLVRAFQQHQHEPPTSPFPRYEGGRGEVSGSGSKTWKMVTDFPVSNDITLLLVVWKALTKTFAKWMYWPNDFSAPFRLTQWTRFVSNSCISDLHEWYTIEIDACAV